MPSELGTWLRHQRQARGWPVREMARQLRAAAISAGDNTVPGIDTLARNIRRWEAGHSGMSERYELHYCKALGIPPGRFGPNPPPQPPPDTANAPAAMTAYAPGSPAVLAGPLVRYFPPGLAGPRLLPPAGVAYRWMQEPDLGDFTVEREVLMAAHEGREHAERAEPRDVGEATLEQLRADVVRLSREYVTGEPFALFHEMRQVRARMHAALDRRLWPRDASALYFLLGGLNGLMSHAAQDLGYPHAAEELIRSGWVYAAAIDHRPLMGFLRARLASVSYWQGQPRQAHDLALAGLRYLPDGLGAARLHLLRAQAAAALGDAEEARAAVIAAEEARQRGDGDELHAEIGGQFAFSIAKHTYLAGSSLSVLPGSEASAVAQLGSAIGRFETGPPEDRSYGCEAIARINLALARIRNGDLDAVDLQPVLGLPTDKRIDALPKRLAIVRSELAHPGYQGSPQARQLDERIEEFCRETIVSALRELPGGPG